MLRVVKFFLGIATLLILALAACSPSGGDQNVPAAQTVTVVTQEFQFSPNRIEVAAGQPAQIVLQNDGTLQHEINVDVIVLAEGHVMAGDPANMANMGQLHLHTFPGQIVSAVFTPTEPGSYRFYCTIPGHELAGMVGELVVE